MNLFLLNVLAESIMARYFIFYGMHLEFFPLLWWVSSNPYFIIFLGRNQSRISKQCSFLIIRISECWLLPKLFPKEILTLP